MLVGNETYLRMTDTDVLMHRPIQTRSPEMTNKLTKSLEVSSNFPTVSWFQSWHLMVGDLGSRPLSQAPTSEPHLLSCSIDIQMS